MVSVCLGAVVCMYTYTFVYHWRKIIRNCWCRKQMCAHSHCRRPLLCENAKSFLVSNLASTTLCTLSFSLSHSFIYIHFLIHLWPSSNTLSIAALFCMQRGRKAPNSVPTSTLQEQPQKYKSEREAELIHSTCYYEKESLRIDTQNVLIIYKVFPQRLTRELCAL